MVYPAAYSHFFMNDVSFPTLKFIRVLFADNDTEISFAHSHIQK